MKQQKKTLFICCILALPLLVSGCIQKVPEAAETAALMEGK